MADVTTIASQIAAEHPDTLLPCPFCAAEVKGANLAKHIGKVHPGAKADATVRGADNMISIWLTIATFAGVALSIIAADQLDMHDRLWALVPLVVLAVGGAVAALAFLGKFPASIEVDGTGLTLRRTLRTRRVPLPIRIETGTTVQRRESMMAKDGYGYYGPYEEHHAGSYMRFVGADGASFVAGAKKSSHPRKFWDFDHIQGTKRKRWHIQLKPSDLVRLQYLLSEHGVFTVRSL